MGKLFHVSDYSGEPADEFRPSREEKLKDDGTPYATPQWIVTFPDMPTSLNLILRWLAGVLMLDHAFPIYKVVRSGPYGPDGIVTLYRRDAREVCFMPCSRLSSAPGVVSALSSYMIPTDLKPFPYTDQNCSDIWYAIRQVAIDEGAESPADQGRVILNMFLHDASPVAGFTVTGSAVDRYKAIEALRDARPERNGAPEPAYLVDANTGMFVMRAGDLQPYVKLALGVPSRGDLDRTLAAVGWERRSVQGWERAGKEGRGRHNRVVIWIGTV
jgi:hypothetical protein